MTSKAEKEKQKLIQEKCQTILNELLRDEDNKYCVDCDAKGPRWASWNLGIFLCIRCAGIHRNLGVHISKVKSVNLDTWTPDQVVSLQQMGNSRARAVYEANLPDSFRRPQHDSSLEAFIRSKYEQKKYIAKEWVPPVIPKVNWDREIEESRKKKEGKRKVTSGSGISLPAPELHAIPKPKSPSGTPKPVRAAATIAALETAEAEKKAANNATKSPSSAAIDLLGLDAPSPAGQSGDDIFTSFLSAPPAADSLSSLSANLEETSAGKRSAEEESFFNQPASNVTDKKPLTKDSIMALYSQGGTQQPQQTPQSVFNMQGNMFAQPASAFPAPQSAFPANQSAFPATQSMPNMGFPTAAPVTNGMMAGTGIPAGTCMTGMPQNGMFAGGVPNMGIVSNPFFATGMPVSATTGPAGFQGMPGMMQLPQQMARMNLGGVPSSGTGSLLGGMPAAFGQPQTGGHTLSTNLWQ